MDMREASAMTEASGLTNAQGGIEQEAGRGPLLHAPSPDGAMRFADQLRKMTIKAPLQSLVVAFLLGIWVGRRR
jgi:hypothetical protein